MAVALQSTSTTTATCNAEAEPIHEGDDGIRVEAEPPKTSDGDAVAFKKGAWSKEEDEKLRRAVEEYGIKNWVTIEKFSGLSRPAKNCRLRWLNYLRPNLKKYPFTEEEERLILDLHSKYGNSWSRIASELPGRSDNEIKNFWHKRAKKCKRENIPIYPTTKQEMQQSHTNLPNNNNSSINDNHSSIEPNASNHDYFPTNYPNHTLPQFQPPTLNVVNNPCLPTDVSIIHVHSPQTMISTQQPQFLSSPSSLLTTSSHQQSPTDHFSHQTILFPNTPSQTPNLPLSPCQTSQPTETTLSVPDHLQARLLCQGGGANTSSAFTSLRKPPILSSPRGPLRRFLRSTSQLSPVPGDHSIPDSAHLAANASTLVSPDSSAQMQWPSAMESPRSPLKLKLSPGVPATYPVQMSMQTADSPVALLPGVQLNSPSTAPVCPLKLRLSIPVASESCFQSNLSIPDSTVQSNSSTSAVPLSSPQLEPSQPMKVDTDHTVPPGSSLTVNRHPPSSQFHPPETSWTNSCMHDVESDSNMEIMDELRKAQARVRFLKKKLRQRRISNKRSLLKQSSTEELLSSESPEATELLRTEVPLHGNSSRCTIKNCAFSHKSSRTTNFLGGNLRVHALPKNSRKKDNMIGISEPEGLQVKKVRKENRENLENGEFMQGSVASETATHGENSESKVSSETSLQRGEEEEEDSPSEIFKRKNSEIFQEQRHSTSLLDHLNSQNNVNAPNSDSWHNTLCTLQGPAGKCSNEYTSVESLLSESSILLQDSFLRGDLFGRRSQIEDPLSLHRHAPLMDAFGTLYGQSSATTLVKPGDEGGQSYLQPDAFGCSFRHESSDCQERKFSGNGFMDGNLAAKSKLCESDLFMHQQPAAADLLDSSYQVSTSPIMKHESLEGEQFSLQNCGGLSAASQPSFIQHQYHAADLLDSGYLASRQIMKQQDFGGVEFSLHSSETSKLCESAFLLHHQFPADSLIDSRYLEVFEHECPNDEYCVQTSAGGFYINTEETWKQQQPSVEQSLMEGLLADNSWPQGQMVSQDQTFSISGFNPVINPMESNNWNNESTTGHTDWFF